MRRAWIGIQCDGCGSFFPEHAASGVAAPLDAAIYTWAMVQQEATDKGWERKAGKDHCPECRSKKGGK